jgi:hypothetical protein
MPYRFLLPSLALTALVPVASIFGFCCCWGRTRLGRACCFVDGKRFRNRSPSFSRGTSADLRSGQFTRNVVILHVLWDGRKSLANAHHVSSPLSDTPDSFCYYAASLLFEKVKLGTSIVAYRQRLPNPARRQRDPDRTVDTPPPVSPW